VPPVRATDECTWTLAQWLKAVPANLRKASSVAAAALSLSLQCGSVRCPVCSESDYHNSCSLRERGRREAFHEKLKELDGMPPEAASGNPALPTVTVDLGRRPVPGPSEGETVIFHGCAWSRVPCILRDGLQAVPGAGFEVMQDGPTCTTSASQQPCVSSCRLCC